MTKIKLFSCTLAILSALTLRSFAQDAPAKPTQSTNAPAARTLKQADAASTTAKFGKTTKSDAQYKSALDAHALEDALKLVGKEGAIKGTVTKVFEPRNVAIINFDKNFRNALTAVVQATNYAKFPALTNLVGKDILVTGKFSDYQGRAQLVLTNAEQIKIVEGEAK